MMGYYLNTRICKYTNILVPKYAKILIAHKCKVIQIEINPGQDKSNLQKKNVLMNPQKEFSFTNSEESMGRVHPTSPFTTSIWKCDWFLGKEGTLQPFQWVSEQVPSGPLEDLTLE